MQPTPEKYLSLDYDNCGMVLNPQNNYLERNPPVLQRIIQTHYPNPLNPNLTPEQHQRLSGAYTAARAILHTQIKRLMPHGGTLLNGSGRQDHVLNEFSSIINQTESCFTTIEGYAEANQFSFCPLLLADRYDENHQPVNKAVGETLRSHSVTRDMIEPWVDLSTCQLKTGTPKAFYSKSPAVSECKNLLVETQIKHAMSLHPENHPIEFIFIDDRKDILESLKFFFSSPKHKLPRHITLRLYCFDAYYAIASYCTGSGNTLDLGRNPKLFYGYGGFNIPYPPAPTATKRSVEVSNAQPAFFSGSSGSSDAQPNKKTKTTPHTQHQENTIVTTSTPG